ncbi:MAG TPA: transcription-repair coupling factor [Bacteroidales bacterium]|nr:transcription-repair coupling factor [Bacteroidales bacterium]HQP03582.1 transcription-repair coupling factor [Bacteroidales bacterium]
MSAFPENIYTNDTRIQQIAGITETGQGNHISLCGLAGSASAYCLAALFKKTGSRICIILDDKEKAAYFYDDMVLLSGKDNVLFYPSSYKRSLEYEKTDSTNIVLKTEALERLSNSSKPYIVVSYPAAISEKVLKKSDLKKNTMHIGSNDQLSMDFVIELLFEFGFTKEDFVYEPGCFAVRGSIIDVFSYGSEFAFRIDFFGDTVESIRAFDTGTQLSTQKLRSINIVPNIHDFGQEQERISFFEYLGTKNLICFENKNAFLNQIEKVFDAAILKSKTDKGLSDELAYPERFLVAHNEMTRLLTEFNTIEFRNVRDESVSLSVEFNTSAQPVFGKEFDLLGEDIIRRKEAGYTVNILSENPKQHQRLREIFEVRWGDIGFETPQFTVHEGFIDHDHKVCIYTDHQIFERYHRFKVKDSFSRKDAISYKELQSINPGDFVVHIDSGIGRFGGLTTIENNGKLQEVVTIHYADNDVLFVNIHSLHRISKYRSKDDTSPSIHRLGSGHWKRLKEKTKQQLKDIARELIVLYAKRSEQHGFAFSADNYLQNELESSFIYEDTPDQIKVTREVKNDMEKTMPMDRLVCGDVGFGKTEIAIRAAFKAVCDGKQVALLVPTTILALQHYQTFRERLEKFPVTTSYISRLRSPSEIKSSLKDLKEGKLDILIGTHRLVASDVEFKDLGLLIIDEEQKFGVAVKEKLKKLKLNVDTLTLTATPIPRTLQFSLMGARDLSVLSTPPPNRQPIVTELHTFNHSIIKDAIQYEVNRNGQVFFVNNRIDNIYNIQATIKKLCPEVSAIVAHGQMEGKQLEKIILDFMRGDFDVLISTSIIENGVDIPNANTIIINNANNFGLSDLHQMRGRVGRSNRKAFCYMLAPPEELLTPEARRRLKAIEEYNELGSGFNIALQDLDIRGAGDIFGAEQSGFIANIGFETYNRIISEALTELKDTEFNDQFGNQDPEKTGIADLHEYEVADCSIETDFEVLLPSDYISSTSERINLYRQLDEIKTDEELEVFRNNLIDRFGKLPQQAIELLDVVTLRRMAMQLGFIKIIIKTNLMIAYFSFDQQSAYYSQKTFASILQYIQNHHKKMFLKEHNGKLSLRFEGISNIQEAVQRIQPLADWVNQA